MSHSATNWAIKQRGLKPAAKLVLWHLCDRYHPDNGCFPSQETLAADCELSRSALNEHLAALERANLIRRQQRRDDATHRQRSTIYKFAFEDDFGPTEAGEPCPESGHGAVSGFDAKPCPENAESRVRNPDTNLVREPVREPLSAQARERAPGLDSEKGAGVDKSIDREFWKLVRDWPDLGAMPKQQHLEAFKALDPSDRSAAIEGRDRWLATLRRAGKKYTPTPSTYFRERLWVGVPAATEQPVGVTAPPFGPLWQAARLAAMVEGPGRLPEPRGWAAKAISKGGPEAERARLAHAASNGFGRVRFMHERAGDGKGCGLAAAEAERLHWLTSAMEAVPVGSGLWKAWEQDHARRGWPWLPSIGRQPVVWFPAGGPAALAAILARLGAPETVDRERSAA